MGLSISVTEAEIKRKKQRALRQQQKKIQHMKNKNKVGGEIILKSVVLNQGPIKNQKNQEPANKLKNLIKTDYQSQMMRYSKHQIIKQYQAKKIDNFQETKQTLGQSNLKTISKLNQTFNLGPVQFANIDQLKQRSKRLRTQIKQQMEECRMNNRIIQTSKTSRSLIYDNDQYNSHTPNCQVQPKNQRYLKTKQSIFSKSNSSYFKRSEMYNNPFQNKDTNFQQSSTKIDFVRIRNF